MLASTATPDLPTRCTRGAGGRARHPLADTAWHLPGVGSTRDLAAERRGTYDARPPDGLVPPRPPHPAGDVDGATVPPTDDEDGTTPPPTTDGSTAIPRPSAGVAAIHRPGHRTGTGGGPARRLARQVMHQGRSPGRHGTLAETTPILQELPALAGLLDDLAAADLAIARAVTAITQLRRADAAAALTGVDLTGWIQLVARRTRTDTRMLLTAADQLERVPCLRNAFAAGAVSWAQVRVVVLELRTLPRTLDDRIDDAVAEALDGAAGAQPDDITRTIRWALQDVARRAAVHSDPSEDAPEPFVARPPRLDGTGGRLFAELDAVTFALADAALSQGLIEPAPRSRSDRSRSDRSGGSLLGDRDDAAVATAAQRRGRHRLQRLREVLEHGLAASGGRRDVDRGGNAPGGDRGGPQPHDGRATARPVLLLRADLATLLDRDQVPGTLLTSLLGGHVRLSAAATRALLDARGADLRTVILDDHGRVVGVGRRRRRPPGWLRDATLALHDTCSAPGCLAPARTCDLDHARPWTPIRDGPASGTDVDELAPLCRADNLDKERAGWAVTQTADGVRRWHHPRSGLQTRTLPATWRPPPN
ncbi:MAG: HNH endonuclease [Nitriliruptoraceae bacterium]|nr:HNH endonuclease [Nitriliruptoraceae bacterium]